MAFLALAMCGSGVLRATGDAKRSMYITVWSGLVNALLDPILIFSLGMGIKGAAWASVIARLVAMLVALNGVIRVHGLIERFRIPSFLRNLGTISKIAIPAMLTNVATPVAFGIVFALSGTVGPIIGQNFGANRMDRVSQTVWDAIKFSCFTVLTVFLFLFLLQDFIIAGFQATEDAAILISILCSWIAISFIFNGMIFISNAAFNNLGYAHYSTIINFTKATLGTIPFVYVGAKFSGAPGVIIGQAIGTVLIGSLAIMLCFYLIKKCSSKENPVSGS